MKTKTTSTNLIDVLPTLFGLIALVGLSVFSLGPHHRGTGLSAVLFLIVYGGAALAVIGGLISLIVAAVNKRQAGAWQVVNLVWLLGGIALFVLYVNSLSHLFGD